MLRLILTSVLLTASATPSLARPGAVIPMPFRGVWESDLASCGNDTSESRIVIDRTSVMGYEHGGTATRVRWLARDTVRIDANIADEMGDSAPGWWTYRISADRQSLTQLGEGQSGAPLHRCPPRRRR